MNKMIDELKIFIKKVEDFNQLRSSEQIDFFAHFFIFELKYEVFTPSQIEEAFKLLRILPYSNIPQYLTDNSNKAKNKKKKVKFLKTKDGFHFVNTFENEIKARIKEEETAFFTHTIDPESLEWKPSNIPFLNAKIKKNAEFFSKLYFLLYHLENSLRKFLTGRLNSLLGNQRDTEVTKSVDLSKAQSIRRETNLSEMIQDRGENILYYCMRDDYGKIIKKYPAIFTIQRDCDEILAHLNSLAKIRNAIAHNTSTVPTEYQDELTLFMKKYIKIMKNNGGS